MTFFYSLAMATGDQEHHHVWFTVKFPELTPPPPGKNVAGNQENIERLEAKIIVFSVITAMEFIRKHQIKEEKIL